MVFKLIWIRIIVLILPLVKFVRRLGGIVQLNVGYTRITGKCGLHVKGIIF